MQANLAFHRVKETIAFGARRRRFVDKTYLFVLSLRVSQPGPPRRHYSLPLSHLHANSFCHCSPRSFLSSSDSVPDLLFECVLLWVTTTLSLAASWSCFVGYSYYFLDYFAFAFWLRAQLALRMIAFQACFWYGLGHNIREYEGMYVKLHKLP